MFDQPQPPLAPMYRPVQLCTGATGGGALYAGYPKSAAYACPKQATAAAPATMETRSFFISNPPCDVGI